MGRDIETLHGWVKDPKNIMVVLGAPGCGKTHLCAALIEVLADRVENLRYFNERQFFREIRSSFAHEGDYLTKIGEILSNDLFILDDVGSSGHTEWREEILMESIDFCYSELKPLIITTNLTRDEIKQTYGQRIHSRLFAKENTVINMENYSDRRQ